MHTWMCGGLLQPGHACVLFLEPQQGAELDSAAARGLCEWSPAMADKAWVEGKERHAALGLSTPASGWGYKYSP